MMVTGSHRRDGMFLYHFRSRSHRRLHLAHSTSHHYRKKSKNRHCHSQGYLRAISAAPNATISNFSTQAKVTAGGVVPLRVCARPP